MELLYKLKHSVNSKEIGIYDQIQTHGTYDRVGPDSYIHVPIDGPIDFDIKFPVFIMEKRARKTDWLTCVPLSGKFLVISPKTLEVFKTQNIDNFQSYPVKISHKDEEYDYYAFYLTTGKQREFINWKESEFSLVNNDGFYNEGGKSLWKELKLFKFNNYDEYLSMIRSFRETNQRIRPKTIKFTGFYNSDLFRLRNPVNGYYCLHYPTIKNQTM